MGEASNPDNVWYGTPSTTTTILQSKRKQDDEESPHEETRTREDKEDRKRRRLEAKRQKSKPMVVVEDEKPEVSEPKAPPAPVSVQDNGFQIPENPPSRPTIISRTSSHEEQLPGGSADVQAGLRAEGVSMRHSSFEGEFI